MFVQPCSFCWGRLTKYSERGDIPLSIQPYRKWKRFSKNAILPAERRKSTLTSAANECGESPEAESWQHCYDIYQGLLRKFRQCDASYPLSSFLWVWFLTPLHHLKEPGYLLWHGCALLMFFSYSDDPFPQDESNTYICIWKWNKIFLVEINHRHKQQCIFHHCIVFAFAL